MSARVRLTLALLALPFVPGGAPAADDALPRTEIAKRAKAAAALLEFRPRYATAFCVHPSGLFVTNDHALRAFGGDNPSVSLVLNAGLRTQKVLKAEVVRRDKELDLALLRLPGQRDLPSLALGSDEGLDELAELVVVGFPFGTALAGKPGQFPAISVNLGSVTSLRRDDKGDLNRIQLDAELNPGNSGGPVLDRTGKVVGVVVSGIQGSGVNMAIPVSHLQRFLARPEILFTPPVVARDKKEQPVEFRAEVISVLPMPAPYELELAVGPEGRAARVPMTAADGSYRAKAVAFPPRKGPIDLRLAVRYPDGMVSGTVSDREVHVGSEAVKLSQVRRFNLGQGAVTQLWDGRTLQGGPSDLKAFPVRVGGQEFQVKLAGSAGVNIDAPEPSDVVSVAVVAKQAGKEVGTLSAPVYLEGAEQSVMEAIRDGRFSRPLHSASPVTYLRAVSTPGDYIGQGKTYSFTGNELVAQKDYRGFQVTAGGYNFHFGGPSNTMLAAREYLDAKRHPFSNEAPGIEISGNGRGCNTIAGKFVVWEFAVRGNEVLRLAIDFTQRCEEKGPPFYGKIRINSTFY
jgi:hypothetical protein